MKIAYLIFELFKERVVKILPQKEVKFLPNYTDLDKSYLPFCDLIFIIEKFINSRIFPLKYEIIYSSKYNESKLPDKANVNLQRLKSKLISGDASINNNSFGFLPKSTKNYLKKHYGNFDDRYNVDFNNQFFGIKHFHLDSFNRKENILLFYVKLDNKIYFLKIGGHEDLYRKDLVENLICEFPDIINQLGIYKYPDMLINEEYNYSIDEIKRTWKMGGNVSYCISNKYYTSCNLQTLSRINAYNINIVQNIYYQIENNLNQFISQLKLQSTLDTDEMEFEPLLYEDNQLFHGCNILIGEKKTKIAVEFQIGYLKKLKLVDQLIMNCNS
jgi:hypothetical protein